MRRDKYWALLSVLTPSQRYLTNSYDVNVARGTERPEIYSLVLDKMREENDLKEGEVITLFYLLERVR